MEFQTLAVFTLIQLIPGGLFYQLQDSALQCYQCVAFTCTNELTICHSARDFLRRQLPAFYHISGEFPECPDPSAVEDWEQMKYTYPSSSPCQQAKDGEATCVLGRFRITTLITESDTNVTAHGTVLGCAQRTLMNSIAQDLIDRPVTKETLNTLRECHLDKMESSVRNSLKHTLEMEHCSVITDICHTQSFCIEPELSVVKPFLESKYATHIPIWTFIWIAIALFVVVAVFTFLGIKYN